MIGSMLAVVADMRTRKTPLDRAFLLVKPCGAEGNRTPNPCLAKAVLCQLSYSPPTATGRLESLGLRLSRLAPQVGLSLSGTLAADHEQRSASHSNESEQFLHVCHFLRTIPTGLVKSTGAAILGNMGSRSKVRVARWRRYWDKQAPRYDKQMEFWDRKLFRNSRAWVCEQARGDVLEVAIGTGLNLPHYPTDVALTGIEFSPSMLARARDRAAALGRGVDLREGDAHHLALPDAAFDTVVCTFGLCAIPDEARALAEMARVLRPGGTLLLADHIAGRYALVRLAQRLFEVVSVPTGGEHFLRRPSRNVLATGLEIQQQQRFGPAGIVERLAAHKPPAGRE